ncbi:DUF1993 family protein [Microbulbifer thermotolerans]|uniref:DUF1993 domain-containing protein n=1 Tax=Microbulbifer thermotolerans TaxID=252514 RepID=A0A143HPB1_MICTH|nr:DUF1993 family protein [Microbulbifer thermotolerans]AMX03575.1 hypothetical protein A3224_14200 [Microbulbifer thermotolerans]MCX2778203.1 DUF1993 domain-containing protein [Microbulbifer thermotolerans]MCX2782164.1 DUF1993 domain-containing protein [Microbulbifer thermotolerans]MCX2795255.1 DUF1993 domain-containing protein [Microbulbifer thermotolerans]MCX2801183.1 DUF1993 domain-containing protein [Microbulbifer thermotolerans]
MAGSEICEVKRIFTSRIKVLEHILSVGEAHFSDMRAIMHERLAEDMFPFGAQIALACNQPRGFAQWCAGDPIENLNTDVDSPDKARALITQTCDLVASITADDSRLDDIKCINLGPDTYCELPAHRYVNDFLIPNLYFHITVAYAILRKLGAPIGRADFTFHLSPYVTMKET